ncbi:hypothetical protein BC628DRAFT_1414558 [Trametes gibbosa]|nr:hypothetical protein BC628DRAFT_1414558 [Trametes gibbosa]
MGSGLRATVVLALTPPFPSLDNTYGILLIGTCLESVLYGIIMHQAYRYTRSPLFKGDSVFVRYTVALVMILQTWHSALSLHATYYCLVSNYSVPPELLRGAWTANLLPVSMGVTVLVCQSFFVFRIWYLNQKFRLLPGLAFIFLLGQVGLSTATTVEAFSRPYSDFSWMMRASLGTTIAADGIVTGLLIAAVRNILPAFRINEPMSTRINKGTTLDTIIMYTVHTGLLTGVVTLISLIVDLRYPHTSIANGLNECTTKLYASTLLAVLSSHDFLRRGADPYMPTRPSAYLEPSSTTLHFAPIQDTMTITTRNDAVYTKPLRDTGHEDCAADT